MKFRELRIPGAFVVELERRSDPRGFFARTYCEQEFLDHGLLACGKQCNVSWNRLRGTLRGMHFQGDPHPEAKLVRCTGGSIYDVVLDLRPASPCYLQWEAITLEPEDGNAVYVPHGCAHGFQTLDDNTEVFYQMSEFYHPELATGVRWDDPAFAIEWPLGSPILSEKDAAYPPFRK